MECYNKTDKKYKFSDKIKKTGDRLKFEPPLANNIPDPASLLLSLHQVLGFTFAGLKLQGGVNNPVITL